MSVTSRRHQDWPLESKVYIGGLRSDCTRIDIEEVFEKYGKILNIWIAQRPPGFGFLLFEDAMDAKDACRALDNNKINGHRVKVEMAREYGTGGSNRDRDRRRSPAPRRRSRSPPRYRRRSRSPQARRRSPERRDRSRSNDRRRR